MTQSPRVIHWVQSPEKSWQAIQATTIQEAIKAESAPIAHIKIISETGLKALLSLIINDLADFVNVGKNMTGEQVVQTVNLIVTDKLLVNLKPEDFKVCFDYMKKGVYGKFFDRLDGQLILECLYKYVSEKQDVFEQLSILKAQEQKNQLNNQAINPQVLEIMKSVIKDPEVKVEKKKPEIPRNAEVTKIFAEFDEIWKHKPLNKTGKRFIKFEGKEVDQIEYLERRLGIYKNTIEDKK